MQHGSNNKSAQFTDVELMTAYLWGAQQGLLTRKSIYNFIRTYHLGEFQKLPSYQAFCRRLNRLAAAFAALAEVLFEQKLASSEPTHGYVLDSCPVGDPICKPSGTSRSSRRESGKSTMFLFPKMPCPPASVPCGSRLRSFSTGCRPKRTSSLLRTSVPAPVCSSTSSPPSLSPPSSCGSTIDSHPGGKALFIGNAQRRCPSGRGGGRGCV